MSNKRNKRLNSIWRLGKNFGLTDFQRNSFSILSEYIKLTIRDFKRKMEESNYESFEMIF